MDTAHLVFLSLLIAVTLLIFVIFLVRNVAFHRKIRVSAKRSYIYEYEDLREDWESQFPEQIFNFILDRGGVSSQHEREEHHERIAENLLFAMSGGGIIWAGTALQDSLGRDWRIVTGLFLLGAGLLCVCAVRFVQVDRYYFMRGEWEKNLREYSVGKISKAELSWRTLRVQNERNRWFTRLALCSLALSITGYLFILLGLPLGTSIPTETWSLTPV